FLATMSKGIGPAVIVGCACAAYQELENRLIVPHVYGRVLRLPSAAVLLALPFAAALRMLVEELRVELPGDDRPDEHLRAEDEKFEQTYETLAAGASATKAAEIATDLAEARDKEAPAAPITAGKKDRG
ncbi:MAG: hypothetical protein ACXWUG_17090, partial [Polyangiales bacterium]